MNQNIFSPRRTTLHLTAPIYKHKTKPKKHIKRPASITMKCWAFFASNDKTFMNSPPPVMYFLYFIYTHICV